MEFRKEKQKASRRNLLRNKVPGRICFLGSSHRDGYYYSSYCTCIYSYIEEKSKDGREGERERISAAFLSWNALISL